MGEGECLLNRSGIFIWGDEKVLELLDRGGAYTTAMNVLKATDLHTLKCL